MLKVLEVLASTAGHPSTLSTMPSPAETNPLPEVRGALLRRVPHHLEGERDSATVQPSQRDVDGLCARTSAEGKGDSHGSHLRKSLHHHPDLHDHGSQVSVDRPLDAVAHMARHTFGARRNALTFPLPLEELFLTLQDQLEEVEEGGSLVLPRVGEQLSEVARVLLRTNQGGETTEEEVKSLIHQAIVRRQARHNNRQNESRHAV